MKNKLASILFIQITHLFTLVPLLLLTPIATFAISKSIYDLKVKDIDGKEVALSQYKGKVLMVVNTASNCGYTPQYDGLEAIYQKYKDKGFVVLAFPSNDFGSQEPGTNAEIKKFCDAKEGKYKTTFPLFAKVPVTKGSKAELYKVLTETATPAGEVSWNFEKFIIDKKGQVVGRFKSKIKPEDPEITKTLESLL